MVGGEATSAFFIGKADQRRGSSFSTIGLRVHGGFSRTFHRKFTLNLGAAISDLVVRPGATHLLIATRAPFLDRPALAIGSQLRLGGRDLPLAQYHLSRFFSIDLYSSVALGANALGNGLRSQPRDPPLALYFDTMVGFSWVVPAH